MADLHDGGPEPFPRRSPRAIQPAIKALHCHYNYIRLRFCLWLFVCLSFRRMLSTNFIWRIFWRGGSNVWFDFSDPDLDTDTGLSFNYFAADFLAPSAGKNIYVREIKLQSITFVNTAITVANGTEGVLSTLVANGTGTVSDYSRQRQRKS